ncbi:AAA family ATPase [Dactylosporangium sp. NPDC005555]|uniref:P-loop NTPase n=1 Tax=Dactylosporangium sp. NPDC005555 TaxID=3154889 RepID=UPI0033B427C4
MLGGGDPGLWLEADQFFDSYQGTGLYSHNWPLLGRDVELRDLVDWLNRGPRPVALLSGRGGIGKSRLLRAFAEAAAAEHGYLVRFLDREASVRPADIEVLPASDRTLVIVDDAHESTSVANTIAGILRVRPGTRILLSARPYGLVYLHRNLRTAGLHPTEVPHWQLPDLTGTAATDLAEVVLGEGHDPDVARRLAAIGRDCPLLIVVGGSLIRTGNLDAARVGTDDLLRDEVMDRFATVLTSDPAGESGLRREVLHAVAALQPFRLNQQEFRSAVEAVTSRPFDQVMFQIRGLESAGVLLRRGDAVRIVPDLLGDAVLTQAIADVRSGSGIGYLERLLPATSGDALLHLVLNASRVDWNVRTRASEPRPSLVDALWDALVIHYEVAEYQEQLAILRRLQHVTFYRPSALWNISRLAYSSAMAAGEGSAARAKILDMLPPVLERSALDFDRFDDSVDLLWTLAQQRGKADQNDFDHPIHVLRELAAFKPWKPVSFNMLVVGAVKRWIGASGPSRPAVSPLEVLQPLLATDSTEQESDGLTIILKQYLLDPTVVEPVRRKAVDVLRDELSSSDRWRATRAAESLHKALVYPHLKFGRSVPPDQRERWTPDFVETLGQIRDVIRTRPVDPVVAIGLRRSLQWHARFAAGPTKVAAQEVLAAVPDTVEYDMAVALHDGWARLTDDVEDFREAQRAQGEKLDALSRRVLETWSSTALLEQLARCIQAEQDAALTGNRNPDLFASVLLRHQPSLAQELAATVLHEPDGTLAILLPCAVAELVRSDADAGWDVVNTLIDRDRLRLTRLTAAGVGRYRGEEGPMHVKEQPTLRRLLHHEDENIRCYALDAVRWIGRYDRAGAADLALSVSFTQSSTVAREVFAAFGEHGYLSYDDLGEANREQLIDGLADLAHLDDYEVQNFLARTCVGHPERVLELLKRRTAVERDAPTAGYRALPFHWDHALPFRETTRFAEFLNETLEWIAEGIDRNGSLDRADVFAAVAGTFDDDVLNVLDRAMATGTVQQIRAVGLVLSYAHRTLVWDNPDFVIRVLRAAEPHGESCQRTVRHGLGRSVVRGGWGGKVGEPFPQDIEQRNRSAAVAATLSAGSPERAFYDDLAATAEAAIRSEIDHDREYSGSRDW